ncbi:hypothetical protein HEP_00001500 [Hepatocystis sp. ex Piliocolobus tephrosceles]|nr:hypothetical protein HEP_00001500 [Hepatocystis sp. ex Piliocolobus tephrosceles]
MKLQIVLFFNALLYSSCVLSFKTKISFRLTETNASLNEEANSEEVNFEEANSEEVNYEEANSEKANYQEQTDNSVINLLFINKNIFVAASAIICALERDVSYMYLNKMKELNKIVMHNFIDNVLFGKSINKAYYDKKNSELIKHIKVSIEHLLRMRYILYAQHKINSMAYRIFQRIVDYHVFYYGKLLIDFFTLKEREHTSFWIQQLSNELGNTDLNIRDYYLKIRERLNNDNVLKEGCDPERIHNMTCRIMQFLSDVLYIDSFGYQNLLKIQ